MTGDCVIQSLYRDGEQTGVKVLQADDVITVSMDMLRTIDSPFADFADPYFTVLAVNGPVVYRVGGQTTEWPYDSRVAELIIA